MAYKAYSEQTFPAWWLYQGAYEVGTWTFHGPPEQVAPISIVSKIVSGYIEQFRLHGEALLYLKVEVDKSPTLETKYRVTTFSHDSPFPMALVYAIIGMVVVIGLVYIVHTMQPAIKDFGDFLEEIPNIVVWSVGGMVVLGSLWLIFGRKRGRRDGSEE